MPATNEQVQTYVDSRVRQRCEQFRAIYNSCKDDKAAIVDVYANLTDNPDWIDNRSEGPPHLMTPSDVLAWNAFVTGFISLIEGTFGDVGSANSNAAQWPIITKSCVRPVGSTQAF